MAAGAGTAAGAVRALPSTAASYDRVPPHNLDAEVSVLGSMLLSKDAIAEVSELVGPEDFYRGAHRTMFEAMRDLYDRGEPVDPVTLADELESRGTLDDVGGAIGIADLLAAVPTAANALYYGRIVADHALRRRLIDAGTQITRQGYDPTAGAAEAVDASEALIYQVAQRGRGSEFTQMKQLLTASFDLIERLAENNSAITGLATGFTDFDELTAGLQPSNLVIIAARPAMGKSTLVTNLATHVAVELRKPAILFSLEMSEMELVQRILASEAKVSSDRLRTGRLHETDWPKLSQASGRLAEAPLFIDDTAGINLMEIRSKCRRLKQKHGLDLVIVDYLQLMQSHRRVENRVQEVAEISRGLKILAKELEIPVIALSQLSRKPEDRGRDDRRPQLADLRESGCLTGDSRVVLASGETAPISSLCGRRPHLATLDGWRMDTRRASRVWSTGVKPVFALTTADGRRVRATANHPFRVADGWRPLEGLRPGDRVAAPRSGGDHFRPAAVAGDHRRPAAAAGGQGRSVAAAAQRATADVCWDTVDSIEPAGREEVFDITVPGTHNFVADGLVVHNSIEQDADVVCFIYRDEVYDKESAAKGEAELIVAKHRNGPLRTIHLSFIGHHSRFANMARGPMPPGGRPGGAL